MLAKLRHAIDLTPINVGVIIVTTLMVAVVATLRINNSTLSVGQKSAALAFLWLTAAAIVAIVSLVALTGT